MVYCEGDMDRGAETKIIPVRYSDLAGDFYYLTVIHVKASNVGEKLYFMEFLP